MKTNTFIWSNFKKVGFRFSFIYFLLFIIFNNNGAFPFWYYLVKYPTELLYKFIPWFGENIINLDYAIKTGPNGSGDTSYNYLLILLIFIVSFIATIIWSLFDKKSKEYTKLYYWLTTVMRYYVGLMLFSYGIVKIIKLQFPSPSFYRLTQTYGESSPMGLAWTFLGFSDGYNMFMGIAEVAALLLLFRRTVTVGAIITLMTTANVMAVNYFYDIPVKITSTHLVLITLFLLLREAKKLYNLFFKGETIQLTKIALPKFHKKWVKTSLLVLKILLIGYMITNETSRAIKDTEKYGSNAKKPVLYGFYKIKTFTINSDTIPPIENHDQRWRSITIERPGYITIKKMDNKRSFYKSEIDTIKKSILITKYRDTTKKYTLHYKKTDSLFTLHTIIEKDTISLNSQKLTKKDFLLTNRGFHWINERPYNR